MVVKRIISILLVFATVISLFVCSTVASAAVVGLYSDQESVDAWENWIENNFVVEIGGVSSNVACFRVIDDCFLASGVGPKNSLVSLQNAGANWNGRMYQSSNWPSVMGFFLGTMTLTGPSCVTRYDPELGVYRLMENLSGLWLVDSSGHFPYYCPTVEEVPSEYADVFVEATRQDIWLPFSTAVSKTQVSVLTKDSLSDLCLTLNQTDRTCSVRDTEIRGQAFYVIIDSYNNIYANADGCPYVAHYDKTVTDNKYDYIVQEGDTINEGDTIYNDNSTIIEGATTNYEIVDNSKVIDLTNGVFNYIGEQELNEFYVDELVYDMSSQSYSADTYNVTYDNDTYNTYNYTWNITYNITNTYITNIGQTELYEPLELYYVLPDGRSSADLTAEEVAGMSFEFADCVNYAKSATDTYLRALYHFDGNTDDSSYFSTQGKFEWLTGASITYMDVGTFEGALYLGPEEHQFKIALPSNIGSGDFTVQFRYYQEGAADTQSNIENSLAIGGTTVLQWDESYLYSKTSTTASAALGIGSWSEIAVIRSSGTTYLYYNGLKIASFTDTTAYTGTITLTLGDTTRASSMVDELRVINFALAEGGASYICTSVPYDTNAVLVLPDSAFPIADEYWDIKSSNTNLLTQYGLDRFYAAGGAGSSYITSNGMTFGSYSQSYGGLPYEQQQSGYLYVDFPKWGYWSNATTLTFADDGLSIDGSKLPSTRNLNKIWLQNITYLNIYTNSASRDGSAPSAGLFSLLGKTEYEGLDYGTYYSYASGITANKKYTFSLADSDGNVNSITFTMPDLSSQSSVSSRNTAAANTGWISYADLGDYRFGLYRCYAASASYYPCYYLYISPVSRSAPTTKIVYMEFAEASSTDLTAEWVTCMYSSEEVQPNTAAIQTDIPINGYTVGGVRPTFPVRGDVWMPVSNNRITNVYVYNGSAWEEVNARWYTGSRWIPIYAFDITTLEDCWDIADIDTTITAVGSEQEFWNWWKRAWTDFRSWLSGNIGGGGSGVSDETIETVLPEEDGVLDDPDTEEDEGEGGYTFIELATELVGGVWRIVKGFVRTSVDGLSGVVTSVVYIGDFFSFYDDDGDMHGIVNYGGDDLWD